MTSLQLFIGNYQKYCSNNCEIEKPVFILLNYILIFNLLLQLFVSKRTRNLLFVGERINQYQELLATDSYNFSTFFILFLKKIAVASSCCFCSCYCYFYYHNQHKKRITSKCSSKYLMTIHF